MYSSFLLPYISSPTRITTKSRTLIDNIFSNNTSHETLSGNITTTISDHYAQFLLLKDISHTKKEKAEIYNHDFEKLYQNKEKFENDLKKTDWNSVLDIKKNDTDNSFQMFLNSINKNITTHAPIKKLSNKDKKFLLKPWITKGLLTSIKKKNKIRRKSIRAKDPIRKEELHNQFKYYRNNLNKLTRLSKANHYKRFFEENKKKPS